METGTEEEVIRSLEPIQEVKEAHMVYGVYDIVVRVETETMEELKNDQALFGHLAPGDMDDSVEEEDIFKLLIEAQEEEASS